MGGTLWMDDEVRGWLAGLRTSDPPLARATAEAVLALLGGIAGALLGGFATAGDAHLRHWSAVVPGTALGAAVAAALAVGAVAGVYPALRAARLSPAEALRTP